MKILGISNPAFSGVTVATRAICTEYMGVPHFQVRPQIGRIAEAIARQNPDLLLVGGWSTGYDELLSMLSRRRDFPVLSVYHSTVFHGSVFSDELYWKQFLLAKEHGHTDFIGFVQPQTAMYYHKIKKQLALFVPHFFKPESAAKNNKDVFRIGVFGGLNNYFKNTQGAFEVAHDYAKNVHGIGVVAPQEASQNREYFLRNTLEPCQLAIFISHLECYPNTVQECWARGIPVITSPACSGLIGENPLLNFVQKEALGELQLTCGTDAIELYGKITGAHVDWDRHSKVVHTIYKQLSHATETYVNQLFETLISGYQDRKYDTDFLTKPFYSGGALG